MQVRLIGGASIGMCLAHYVFSAAYKWRRWATRLRNLAAIIIKIGLATVNFIERQIHEARR